jgi:hypothetical protein
VAQLLALILAAIGNKNDARARELFASYFYVFGCQVHEWKGVLAEK